MVQAAKPIPFPIRLFRLFLLWFLLGLVYYLIEFLYRLLRGELPHWSMIIVGGLCGIAVGALNQFEPFFGLSIHKQALIGTGITLVVEFAAGCILNLWLGLGIWDYSGLPGNLLGQICLLFGLIWFCIMPFAIWLEDRLRWGFGWNGKAYSLWSIYKEFLFWYREKGNPEE